MPAADELKLAQLSSLYHVLFGMILSSRRMTLFPQPYEPSKLSATVPRIEAQ
jgi:hypothetical protein